MKYHSSHEIQSTSNGIQTPDFVVSIDTPQQGISNEYPQHMFLWRTFCGYSLDVPWHDTSKSKEYHNMFCGETRKI